jgi:hypothetical protein
MGNALGCPLPELRHDHSVRPRGQRRPDDRGRDTTIWGTARPDDCDCGLGRVAHRSNGRTTHPSDSGRDRSQDDNNRDIVVSRRVGVQDDRVVAPRVSRPPGGDGDEFKSDNANADRARFDSELDDLVRLCDRDDRRGHG